MESGSFKYFRTQFQFVTGNKVSVELRDIRGKFGISCDYMSSPARTCLATPMSRTQILVLKN